MIYSLLFLRSRVQGGTFILVNSPQKKLACDGRGGFEFFLWPFFPSRSLKEGGLLCVGCTSQIGLCYQWCRQKKFVWCLHNLKHHTPLHAELFCAPAERMIVSLSRTHKSGHFFFNTMWSQAKVSPSGLQGST